MDHRVSIVAQLNAMHPDRPTCEEVTAADCTESFLLGFDEQAGMRRIDALMLAKYKHALENPGSISFGDIAKISSPKRQKTEVEVGTSIADLFGHFNDKPEEVIDTEDGR